MFKEKFKPHHPAKKKILLDGVEYCDSIFCKHIEIGTPVKVGDERNAKEHEYFPAVSEIKQCVLEVYASNKRNPQFIDDEGCNSLVLFCHIVLVLRDHGVYMYVVYI